MSKHRRILTQSPQETMDFAREFAQELRPGSIVALIGDLGSGKTTFMKGLARGLGLEDENAVKSPTYVIMHIYPTPIPLYHFDLYRLESASELDAIGFEEFIHDPKAIVCIEWADRAAKWIPKTAYNVRLTSVSEKKREIEVKSPAKGLK